MGPWVRYGFALGVLSAAMLVRPRIASACVGDCDGNFIVAVNELVRAVGISLETAVLAVCAAIDNNLDDRATVDELVLGVRRALEGCRGGPADEVLFAPQDNELNLYPLADEREHTLVERTHGTINGQACLLPGGAGRFVVGDDTGQPAVRAGWGIYSADGTFLKKLTLPQRDNEANVPDPLGCAVDRAGRLFTSAIGTRAGADGQLSLFFPPAYDEACILDTTIANPGSITVDEQGNIYVPQLGGVLRYRPPFPTSVAECATVKGTREDFIRDARLIAPLGIVRAANGHWYISVVFGRATVTEFDAEGVYVRDLFAPGSAGTPAGLALSSDGTLYFADLAIGFEPPDPFPGPIRDRGTVRKVVFDAAGMPSPPEIVARGLTFPDSVAIMPHRFTETRTLGRSLQRTYYNPFEHRISRETVTRMIPKWRFFTGGIITASPAVVTIDLPVEGLVRVVFVPSWDGNLYALRAQNGSRIWTFTMKPQPGASYPYASSPTVEWLDGRPVVYVGGGMTMYCIDAATGAEIWQFDAGTGCTDCGFVPGNPAARERNEILSTPAVFNGRVFFGMDVDDSRTKGGMYAVSAADGRLVWYFDLADPSTCRPNPEDNVRRFDGYHSAEELGLPPDFFATREGCDFDRTPNTCGNIWSSVAIDARRGLLYTASSNCDTDNDPETPEGPPPMPPYDEALVAFDFDGVPVWKWRPREVDNLDFAFGGVPNLFEVVIDDRLTDVVGIGNKDGTYYLLDRDGTKELTTEIAPYWQRNVVPGGAIGGIIASAAVGDGRVFFSTAIGNSFAMFQRPAAWALDATDGTVLWSHPDVLPSYGPTVAIPGLAFMGELATGNLNVYDADTGMRLTTLDAKAFPGGVAMAPAVVDGELFVAGGTGTRGSNPDDESERASNFDTPLSAFCIEGTPGCLPACDDGNPCTHDFRRDGVCTSENGPDTLECDEGEVQRHCSNGTCVDGG